jgi:hypothetical protein
MLETELFRAFRDATQLIFPFQTESHYRRADEFWGGNNVGSRCNAALFLRTE